ncbi:MAG: hypothetical protein BWY43_00597 [candidate division WS2 bacterium ADurb.Bin280]|uniref:Uncharacterized protein n=1 Tax=candidate division WS2 bacterium ADurb.Bin280 TaxID=1852829 RepID=A0A1V5SD43_9BACT|nr:MAG: hypothetical protein BWY43_00597 [candidate division WS2 bacterium ADurb.Bin280]
MPKDGVSDLALAMLEATGGDPDIACKVAGAAAREGGDPMPILKASEAIRDGREP